MKKVVVIGCGKFVPGMEGWAIGHSHAQGYLDSHEEVELYGVDVSAENLAAFGERFQVPQERLFTSTAALYEAITPDCVSICTWPALHHPMAIEAMERGVKGIICEKPLTMDVGQLRDLEKRARDLGIVFSVGHQRRMEPWFRKFKEIAASGKLGSRLVARGHVGNGWDILSWTTHWFDMANFIFDAPASWVLAGMDIGDNRRYQHAVENASIVYADYEGGRSAIFLTGPGESSAFWLEGENGVARIVDDHIEVATFSGAERLELDFGTPSGFALVTGEVLRALDGGPEPVCSIRFCATATEMAYAAQESARTGRRVSLPLEIQFAPLEIVQHPTRSILHGQRSLLYADSHFGSAGREGLAEAVASFTGQVPLMIDAESQPLQANDLAGIDVLYLYHTRSEADPKTRRTLSEWVDAGKPLVIVHAALGAWPDWEAYQKWCGIIWEWGVSTHPYEPIRLRVTEGNPLHFSFSEAWLPTDEVFVGLKTIEPVHLGLHAAFENGGSCPVAWRSVNHPGIGVWMPGHRRDSWQLPAMRQGLHDLVRDICTSSCSIT
jgi:predicted dehydrogenase